MAHYKVQFVAGVRDIAHRRRGYLCDRKTGSFVPRRATRRPHRQIGLPQSRPGIVGVAFSIMLGAAGLMVARYLRDQQLNIVDTGDKADVLMMVDFGLAGILVFFLGGLIRHATPRHMLGQAVGICLMLVTMHNLVWAFPREFAQVYSPAFVDQVRMQTAPQSLYLRGETITL